MAMVVGAASDLGRVRTNNEDSYAVLLGSNLPEGLDAILVVADGMGGHQAGEVASGLTVARFRSWFGSDAGPQRIDASLDLSALLARIIREANGEIFDTAVRDPRLHGMGTTVVAAAVAGNRVYLASVGDSRAYLIDDSSIYQLSRDHSWVAEEVRAGRLTTDEAARHPRRNVLTRAVGVFPEVEVETHTYELGAGESLLLCSDGLTNMVSEPELRQIVNDDDSPTRAADHLVQLANQRGAPDNVTVVIGRCLEEASASRRDRTADTLPGPLTRRR